MEEVVEKWQEPEFGEGFFGKVPSVHYTHELTAALASCIKPSQDQ